MLAPIAPAPATTIRAIAPAPTSRPGAAIRRGRLTSSRTGTPSRPRQNFAAAWNGKRSSAARTSPTSPARSRTSRATSSGKTAASPETAPTAPLSSPRTTSDSAPTNTSRPGDEVGLHVLERLVRHLQAREVRRQSAHARDRRGRDRVPRARPKLVQVERQRGAGLGGRGEMADERLLVELVVRRPDDRDRVRADLFRMCGERDRLGRRLRAAMNCDVEPVPGRVHEQRGRTLALVGREQDALAGRAQRQDPVQPARAEVLDVRSERALVESLALVPKRRDRSGESPFQHAPTLSSRA